MGKMDLRYLLVRKLYAFNMHCYLVYLKRRFIVLELIFSSIKLFYYEIDTTDDK